MLLELAAFFDTSIYMYAVDTYLTNWVRTVKPLDKPMPRIAGGGGSGHFLFPREGAAPRCDGMGVRDAGVVFQQDQGRVRSSADACPLVTYCHAGERAGTSNTRARSCASPCSPLHSFCACRGCEQR